MGHGMTPIDNPYIDQMAALDILLSLEENPSPGDRAQAELRHRTAMVELYGPAIPYPDVLDAAAKWAESPIVYPYAGGGYWAAQLSARHIPITAYDTTLAPTAWFSPIKRTSKTDLLKAVERLEGNTLLLVYPPSGTAATVILRAFKGDRLIYFGPDTAEGGCGDEQFFNLLERQWDWVDYKYPPRFYRHLILDDFFAVYDRAPTLDMA